MSRSRYLLPLGLARRERLPAAALPLAGGPLGFLAYAVLERDGDGPAAATPVTLSAPPPSPEAAALLEVAARPRPAFAGLTLERPRVMGIVNVTPDSFSDAGDRFDAGRAVADGLAMAEAGADLVDVGGESTRPGAAPVPPEEERARVLPVVHELARQGVRVSVDSRRAAVMAAALEAGAAVVNDVTALAGDPETLPLVAASDAAVVLMHMQGDPRTMQAAPAYADAPLDVCDFLARRLAACTEAGIAPARIALDPGIGFGKTIAHNIEILERLALLHGLGCPLVLGLSRKSFIGRLSRGEAPKARLAGSLAGALGGLARGVQILRVHDVPETLQAIAVWQAVEAGALGT